MGWLAFGGAYLVLSRLSDWLANPETQFSTFWPAAGLYLGALLLSDRRRWPGFVAAAAVADLLVSLQEGRKPLLTVATVAADAFEATAGAAMVLLAARGRPRLWRLRDLVAVLTLGAVVAPLVPALVGGAATHLATGAAFGPAFLQWWAGDGLGILVVTPLLLAWRGADRLDPNPVRARPVEFALLSWAALAAAWAVFRGARHGALAEEHLVLPVSVWAAVRFGPRGVTAFGALFAAAATWATGWAVRFPVAGALPPDAPPIQGFLGLSVATGLILATEVAGRERSERRLELSRAALDQGAEGVLIADEAGTVVVASEAAGKLLGRRPSALVGTPIQQVDPTLAPPGWSVRRAELAAGGPVRYETAVLDAAGRRLPVEVNAAPVSVDGKEFVAWSARDLSARRQVEEEQRLAAVGTLASGVAHEINNPLTYVTSNLAFLEDALGRMRGLHPEVEESLSAAAEASLGARRVRDIVRDLRFVARPPDGRRIEVDPVGEIRSALNLAQAEILHRARLDLGLEPCPAVMAGQGQIGQVMLHLLVNAAQSIPPGAAGENRVRVTSRRDEEGWASIEVSDTGAGMPAATRLHVFEPFYTTRPVGGGRGLGLSVSHGIVTGMGGRIDLTSEVGRGTTVRVRFPPAEAETAGANPVGEASA